MTTDDARTPSGEDPAHVLSFKDPHPAWLAEARALLAKMNQRGFAPGIDLGETVEYRRYWHLKRQLGEVRPRTLAGAVAQLEMVDDELEEQSNLSGPGVEAFNGALAQLRRLAARETDRG